MPDIGDLEKYVGLMALGCFGGTFLGGMLLSYFWKVFGPWKLLEDVKKQLAVCEENEAAYRVRELRTNAEMADISARFEVLREAMVRSGFELRINGSERKIT